MSDSFKEPGVGTALTKFCKLGPTQLSDIAFLALGKG